MATLHDACREVANALVREGKSQHETTFTVSNSLDDIVVIVRRGDRTRKAPLRKGLTEQVRIILGPTPGGVCECCGR